MYGWKIEHNSVDISDKVTGFTISASLESFCREMTLDIADPSFYAGLDFSQISETPAIEIFTKVGAEWISQGLFFIERPALATTVQSDLLQGVWGRSATAKLADPFAVKVSRAWNYKTTFFAICEEMCTLSGLTWDEAYGEISDFTVYENTYVAENVYPIDVITELAVLAGALVTTDREGHVCIKRIDYAPTASDAIVTDADIESISETPEWPVFGNRIRVTSIGSVGGYGIEVTVNEPCLQADGASKTKIIAQVKDSEGTPVDGVVVNWSSDAISAALDAATSNTQEVLITKEEKRAKNYYMVDVDFPPSSVKGIWAYRDLARKTNLAGGGYSISGNTIALAQRLAFCDQLLVIDYYSQGIAVNYLQAGAEAEDVTVTAEVEGETGTGMVYIDNACQCPSSLTLKANPSSIRIGEISAVLAYVEESGPVTVGRNVYMAEVTATKRGKLSWGVARVGVVAIANEKVSAINEISGITQCELSMFPESVSSIYQVNVNGDPIGGNLYSSHVGKVVSLSANLLTGTDLVANYNAHGAALNHFTGEFLGEARIKAFIATNREAFTEADVTINVIDETSAYGDYPADAAVEDEGEGEGGTFISYHTGGDDDEFDEGEEPSAPTGCEPENVSSNPNDDSLKSRFKDPLEKGCTCEEICNAEFGMFGTNQNYDGGSYKKIHQIVTEDHGHPAGSPEYWEDYNNLKGDALQDCIDQCDDCSSVPALTWPDNNPETIARNSQVSVFVFGGRPPFHWIVSGQGFSLLLSETQSRDNVLIADATACGTASITVTDQCGFNVTGEVRCVSGQWCLIQSCEHTTLRGTYLGYYHAVEIRGKYKYEAYFCYQAPPGVCMRGICAGISSLGLCPTPLSALPPKSPAATIFCGCGISKTWEWKCLC